MTTPTLKELSIEHPYYASDTNYYTNFEDWPNKWDTMTDFLDEFEDADLDMNLVYRWDVHPYDGERTNSRRPGKYCAQVVIIGQRKGIYGPHLIASIEEQEVPRFIEYLKKHWQRNCENWKPIAGEG